MAYKKYNHVPDSPGFPAVNGSDTVGAVNAYQYRNNFDYTKWLPGTVVKLMSVPWDDTDNVVAFEDEAARDKWLNAQEAESIELKTAARLLPDGKISLPIPFDYAIQWNYCVVDFPAAPVDTYAKGHISRWCFFASAIDSKNPNTTVFMLGVDWWQTYVYRAEFTNAMLERGHAPLAAMPASQYLENPINNNSLLLAKDVSYGEADVSKSGAFFAINDEYVFCLALPMTLAQVIAAAQPGSAGSTTDPTFSDNPARWGKEYEVAGYDWGFDIKNYAAVETPSTPMGSMASTVYSGIHMIAVKGDPAAFVSALETYKPEVLANVKGAFALPAKFIALTEFKDIKLGSATYQLAELLPAASALGSFDLTTEAFGYAEEYSEYAKLYTFPYACLEITDADGKRARVKIENTQGTVDVAAKSAVAFPYVSITAYVENIGGSGSCEYQWKLLDGTETTETAPLGMWRTLMWKFEIPTIALYANGYTKWQLHNANSAKAVARTNALKDYHNSMRSLNTAWKNEVASADTEQTNTNAAAETNNTNTVNSAATDKTNAINSAAAVKSNANDSAATEKSNANDTASADKSNAYRSAAAQYNTVINSNNTENTNAAIERQTKIMITTKDTATGASTTNYQNELTRANVYNDIGYNEYAFKVEAVTDAISGVANAVGTGLSGGGIAGGVACGVSTLAGIAKDGALLIGTNNCNKAKLESAVLNATQLIELGNNNAEDKMNFANSQSETITANTLALNEANAKLIKAATEGNADASYSAVTGNAARSYNTATGNASRTYETESGNASRTYDTTAANSSRLKETTESNAARSNKTVTDNSGYTRDAMALNQQLELKTAQTIASSEAQDRKNDAVYEVCAASGSNEADVNKWQGLQVQVVTQNDGAIACAAAQFARYGYILNQPWDIETLNVMPHFSYWKCADVWVLPGVGIIEGARDAIRRTLVNGVTVWRNPDEIGGVSIWQ